MKQYDYIIVGSGIAGLYTALLAQPHGSVLVITKGSIEECNTRHAQGGIAAAISRNDSPDLHFKDTMAAGDGLCDEEAVRLLVNEAPDRINDLVNFGVPFDTVDGEIALTKEAAHSRFRILHAGGDATGEHIEVTLHRKVHEAHIEVREDCLATEIVLEKGRVAGVRTLHCHGGAEEFGCRFLVLATGGAGQLFRFNTNSAIATGDGLALAYEAGAEISDMEFYQFHPTALRLNGAPLFLISEAVRGEGGVLRNAIGYRFMLDYSMQGDLAPRDVVARSILYEMANTGSDRVFIDVTHLSHFTITTRFPHIYRFCLDYGLDITKDPIPVAPAAHYMMGGIKVNTWGETNIPGLFAAGETACTGVHGANRLASNSMLEVLVFSKRIIEKTRQGASDAPAAADSAPRRHYLSQRQVPAVVAELTREKLQQMHWDKVGIIRNQANLNEAADMLAAWQHRLPHTKDRATYELRNLVLTGRLVTEAALIREESRGAHCRTDFPQHSTDWQQHIVFARSRPPTGKLLRLD